MGPPDDLPGMVAWLSRKIAEMERRERNRSRDGVISDVDYDKGLYRVELRTASGERGAFKTPWIPVEALASGQLKIQGEPVLGQSVTVRSESGDMTDAIIALSSFTDDNGRPHDKGGELKIMLSDGAYSQLLDAAGNEITKAVSRTHDTDGDIDFNTGGIVRFN